MKKLLALILALILVAGIAACGNEPETVVPEHVPEVVVAQVMNFTTPEQMVEELFYIGTLADMADWYETNNYNAFAEMFARTYEFENEDRPDLTYQREILMNFRSTYYAERISELLRGTEESTTFFVVVGLSHIIRSMGGEGLTDIVEQLQLQGFTPEPLWK